MPKRHLDELVAKHPHDGLVRRMLTNPEAAAAELRLVLAPSLVKRLDWASLRVAPGTFVDPKLRHRRTDILYSIRLHGTSRDVLVYALLEHQRSLDRLMALRFLIYSGRIWERWLSDHANAEHVPLLIPLLLYQGPRGWTAARSLSDLYDLPPDLAAEIVPPIELTFGVDELEPRAEDDLDALIRDRGAVLAEITRTLLWLASRPMHRWGERLGRLGRLLDELARSGRTAELETVLTYVVSVFGTKPQELRAILEASESEEAREVYTAGIEAMIDTGRVEGRAEGRVEGKAEGRIEGEHDGRVAALLVVLESRGLTPTAEAKARISACTDLRQLEVWLRRAATATSLDDIFAA